MGNCLGQLILAFKDFTNEDQFNSHLNARTVQELIISEHLK